MNRNTGYGTWIKLAAATAAIAAMLSGCGGGAGGTAGTSGVGGQAADGPLSKADEKVQATYKNTCLSCHGPGLEGRVGPQTNLQHVGSRLTQEQIAKQITNGGGNMPAFGKVLKPDDIAALAAWLAATK